MTDLSSLGYPEGYHMGLSAVLWWISIVLIAILGVMLYINARNSDLINVKEMLRAKGFLYIGVSIQMSLIQIGVLFHNYFLLFLSIGGSLNIFLNTLYFYYWEKNLTSIKRIPTISIAVACILSIIGLIVNIFFPLDLYLMYFLTDLLTLIIIILATIAMLMYLYLIFIFTRNVKGVSTTTSRIWMIGGSLTIISSILEFPPGVKIFPPFIVLYIAPISYIVSLSMAYYGITRLFAHISSYYAQTQKCAVHRGSIEKGTTVYYCPSCGITYCETCFNQVIIKDGCWNCRKGAKAEFEEEWKVEQIVEVKKGVKLNHKTPKSK